MPNLPSSGPALSDDEAEDATPTPSAEPDNTKSTEPEEKYELETTDLPRLATRPARKSVSNKKRSHKKVDTTITEVVKAPSEEDMKRMEKERRAAEVQALKSGEKVFKSEEEQAEDKKKLDPPRKPIGGMGMPGMPGMGAGMFGGGNPLDVLKKKNSNKEKSATSPAAVPAAADKVDDAVAADKPDPLAALRAKKKSTKDDDKDKKDEPKKDDAEALKIDPLAALKNLKKRGGSSADLKDKKDDKPEKDESKPDPLAALKMKKKTASEV